MGTTLATLTFLIAAIIWVEDPTYSTKQAVHNGTLNFKIKVLLMCY